MRENDLRRLCDMDAGTIHPTIYTDEAIYREELDRVFGRAWVLLCPEQQIPNPGDWFNTYVGADRVIVVRQKDGSIKGLLNQCRHRGNELARPDSGNAKMFTCSYHGWSYDLAGNLRNVPHEDVVFPDGFDKAPWGCASMAQVDTYKGLVFGTWDPTAPPLLEYLGDAAHYLDIVLDRFDGGLELAGGVNKWIVKANWKILAEQFASDMVHPEIAHVSAILSSLPKDFDLSRLTGDAGGRQFCTAAGHGGGMWTEGPLLDLTLGPEIAKFWLDSQAEAERRLGASRADVLLAHMNIFPASIAFVAFQHIRVLHPLAVDETEVWTWNLVPARLSADMKRQWIAADQRTFGAGGLFETDDSALWSGVQRTMRGVMGRRHPFVAQMGDRAGKDADPAYVGRVARTPYSEVAARAFYQRWIEMLSHDTWTEMDAASNRRFAEGTLR
jgi:phenylpropionate dioxygenase-like ring-hydroxylating dioxygenase large terminal subunit